MMSDYVCLKQTKPTRYALNSPEEENKMQVAQYASSSGQGKAASDAVDECLR